MILLQWNCNGLNRRKASLNRLIDKITPDIIALQETNLKTGNTTHLMSYQAFHHIRNTTDHASGGASIYTNSRIATEQINLITTLEAIAVIC